MRLNGLCAPIGGRLLFRRPQGIPHTALTDDPIAERIDRPAQAFDQRLQPVRVVYQYITPNRHLQFFSPHDLVRMSTQLHENAELRGGQAHLLPIAPDLMPLFIDDKWPALHQAGNILSSHKSPQDVATVAIGSVDSLQQALLFQLAQSFYWAVGRCQYVLLFGGQVLPQITEMRIRFQFNRPIQVTVVSALRCNSPLMSAWTAWYPAMWRKNG